MDRFERYILIRYATRALLGNRATRQTRPIRPLAGWLYENCSLLGLPEPKDNP